MKYVILISLLFAQQLLAGTSSSACKSRDELYKKFQQHEANIAHANRSGTSQADIDAEIAEMNKLAEAYKKADLKCKD